ncbi:MAG: PTS sugar transporter subunit IIA [SAR202 cluster bacterium]|nr:PTS sugar transporter subunit IIA [SAR202 cluster bacterium]
MLFDTGLAVPVAVASSNLNTTVSAVFTLSEPIAYAPLSMEPSGTKPVKVVYVLAVPSRSFDPNVLVKA